MKITHTIRASVLGVLIMCQALGFTRIITSLHPENTIPGAQVLVVLLHIYIYIYLLKERERESETVLMHASLELTGSTLSPLQSLGREARYQL